MNKKVIFSLFNRFPSFFCSLALFGFFTLAGLTQKLNLNLPKEAKVRDEVSFSGTAFPAAEKLDIRSGSKDIAVSFAAAVPVTSRTYITPQNSNPVSVVAQPVNFSIVNPTPVNNPAIDAGNSIMRYMTYGGRFLYAHSSRAFSPLKSNYEGGQITVTMDGQTATYKIALRKVFVKATELDNNSARRLALYSSKYNGQSYDLTLMTCGNGSNDDSNYRLVLFTNRV